MRIVLVFLVLTTVAPHSAAFADDRPWEHGTAPGAKAEALALRDAGDALFVAERYVDAVAKYLAAIEFLPHPKLRLAAALCFIKLSRWVEASGQLETALAYGEAGLDTDLPRARSAFAEATAHTGVAVVSSTQRGAEISVDGRVAFVGVGTKSVRILPGRHVVLAKRGGLTSEAISIEVSAGQEVQVAPMLYVTESRWRWARWKPWAIVGGGVLVAVTGVPFVIHSESRFDDYRTRFDAMCTAGCNPEPSELVTIREHGRSWRYAAIGTFIGGGVLAGLGLVWVALNRQEQRRYVAPDITIGLTVTERTVGLAMHW